MNQQHRDQRYPGTVTNPTARSSRRRFLGATALGSLGLAILNACGKGGDSAATALSEPAIIDPAPSTPVVEASPVSAGVVPEAEATAAAESGVAPAAETAAPEPAAGGAFGEVAELSVSVTYVASGDGRVHNPYIAVWLEDTAGNPIRTLLVSYQQGRKGKKWLPDLKRWHSADQARIAAGAAEIIDTISSPTRLPGTTTVVWDGRNDVGELVPGGAYVLFIEAARERGPYDVISQELDLSGAPIDVALVDSGDLQKATATVKPLV